MSRSRFVVGNIPSGSTPIVIRDCLELENVKVGDVIAPLDDYIMLWDEDCLPPSGLEPWRQEGDDLCDEVVRILDLKPGQDGLNILISRMEDEKVGGPLREFWEQISQEPPPGVTAFPARYPGVPLTENDCRPAFSAPNYKPLPTAAEGQAVFWRYSTSIMSATLHFSLAGGFSAQRLVGVLKETSYLTGEQKDKTYRRLLETGQAMFDYMNDLTPITGQGWKSAVRVRMLHATVRVRLRDKKGLLNTYDEKLNGIPINQMDTLATLGAFAIAPLWSLRRMGITLSPEEELAFISVWRHVGYYLGISPARLSHYYNDVERASKLFTCSTIYLFDEDSSSADSRSTNTYRLLSSLCDRPPMYTNVNQSLAISRFLLGDGLGDRLALPPTPFHRKLRIIAKNYGERMMLSFGRYYSPRWEIERVAITRLLMLMVVCWQLGIKRTRFTIKAFGDDMGHSEKQLQEVGEDLDKDELDPEVRMGPEAGKAIIKRWKWLLGEMVGVMVGGSVVVGLVSWSVYTAFSR